MNSGTENFAPVIIPTLCRYEHFRDCLESLMGCTHADETDVYVGLDYPAKEAHWDGYRKISDYLDSIADSHNFKSLNVIRRERNYGFGPAGNTSELRRFVLSFSDTLIFTEDDNIFSPAFLDYVNKGLDKFRTDSSVLAINGYRHFYGVKSDGNTFFRQNVDFSAWGYGIWKDRVERYTKELSDRNYLMRKALNPLTWVRLYRNGLNRCLDFIAMLRGRSNRITDNTLSVYMAINGMDVVMPCENLVRNMGWDNSGENCRDADDLGHCHMTQPMSERDDFEFAGTGFEFYRENRRIYRRESYGRVRFSDFIKRILKHLS